MNHYQDFARAKRLVRMAAATGFAGMLAACQQAESIDDEARAYHPIPQATLDLMATKGATEMSPVLIRTFKKEAEFEVWKMGADGRYVYIKTFPMCRWSGQLGPKTREGDRQVPEGFYSIGPGQMNPNSHYYLSFNVGYPNAYDRAHGDTGDDIMVHGICSSAGCFSMTNQQMDEIYAIAREAFDGGEREIQMESFPFHMTAENLAKYRLDPNMPFWKQLKMGSDYFDVSHQEPKVGVCGGRYVFNKVAAEGAKLDSTAPCPALKDADPEVTAEVAAKERQDDLQVAALIAKGTPAVRLVYQDGGQNPVFADRVADVSRPDALAQGPVEVPVLGTSKLAGKKTHGTTTAIADARPHVKGNLGRSAAPLALQEAKTTSRPAQISTEVEAAAGPPPSPPPAKAAAPAPFYQRWMSLVSDKLSQPRGATQASSAQPPSQQAP
jgi:murein L,D-transpeptidase YafK